MSIRDTLEQNRTTVTVVSIVIIVAALAWIIYSLRGGGRGTVDVGQKTFYSDDDGKTYFKDDYEKLATPFNGPNGKEAVRAHVYKYPGEQPFVGWLEKYTKEGQKILQQYYANPAAKGTPPPELSELQMQRLVKKPGGKTWIDVKQNPTGYQEVINIPNKGDAMPEHLSAD